MRKTAKSKAFPIFRLSGQTKKAFPNPVCGDFTVFLTYFCTINTVSDFWKTLILWSFCGTPPNVEPLNWAIYRSLLTRPSKRRGSLSLLSSV
ncbi:MAG: hypothetical protein II084_00575, partial [Clostridia bacterium]|nr:hypothetical protein [Clostridia bacterium]